MREPGDQRQSQKQEHAFRDGPHGDPQRCPVGAQPPGNNRQEEPAQDRVGQDLEDRVESHQHRRQLDRAAGEGIPDEHHRDATRQADDDQAVAVGGEVREQQPGERKHHDRPDDPVEQQRGGEEAGDCRRSARWSRSARARAPDTSCRSAPGRSAPTHRRPSPGQALRRESARCAPARGRGPWPRISRSAGICRSWTSGR